MNNKEMNEEYYRNIYTIKDEDTLTLSGKHLREFKEFIRKEMKQEILEIIEEFPMAELLHEFYEIEAKHQGWETQKNCQVKFRDLPLANKTTMLNVSANLKEELKQKIISQSADKPINPDRKGENILDKVICSGSKSKVKTADISLCGNCYCMTKTINGRCGKCKKIKGEK